MTTATPTYLALADDLARQIRRLRPGNRVPSEHELVARHEVSRLTARAAVQELERRHLVRRVRGSGTFVARRLDYRITADAPPSWSETVRRAGGEPRRRVLGIGRVAAPREVSEALGLRPRQRVIAVTRIGTVDGLVADTSTSWLPDDLVDDLDDFLGDGGSLYAALVARGTTPRRRWSTAALEPVPAAVAASLELEGRPVVWRIVSCNEDTATGRAVELGKGWMRPDVYRMTFELGVDPVTALTAERRAELLAVAPRDQLVALADRCAAAEPTVTVTIAPEVGTILLEVREPVAHDRFHLGEVLACRAEVEVEGGWGWAVRLGDDRLATLAAAVCDAEVDAARPLAGEVEALCERAARLQAAARAAEWRELAPTQVAFEELD